MLKILLLEFHQNLELLLSVRHVQVKDHHLHPRLQIKVKHNLFFLYHLNFLHFSKLLLPIHLKRKYRQEENDSKFQIHQYLSNRKCDLEIYCKNSKKVFKLQNTQFPHLKQFMVIKDCIQKYQAKKIFLVIFKTHLERSVDHIKIVYSLIQQKGHYHQILPMCLQLLQTFLFLQLLTIS